MEEKREKVGQNKERKIRWNDIYAHTTNGEKYYMRMLLNARKGCMSFKRNRKWSCPHFIQICLRSTRISTTEWIECINGASDWVIGYQLRQLFTTLMPLKSQAQKYCGGHAQKLQANTWSIGREDY